MDDRKISGGQAKAATSGADAPRADEARKGWRHKDAVGMLRRLIEVGDLAPGDRLREVAISEKLGMSRTPVREAFRTLAAEGLVRLLPNRSVVVNHVDRQEIADVLGVLGTLEGMAAEQACERITNEEIELIGALQEDLERYYADFERENYVNVNRRVHEVIAEASRNSALLVAWRTVLPRVDRVRNTLTVERSRWTEALYEHRVIYKAIAERDSEHIAELMRTHIGNCWRHDEAVRAAKRLMEAAAGTA